MNFGNIQEIIRRKPPVFLMISIGYLLLAGFFRWAIHPTIGTALFLAGGVIGVYFLDIAEVFFRLSPSPFRSIVFEAAFIAVSLFVVTSSGSMITSGLVLSLFLTMLLWQTGQWQIQHNLDDWFRMVNGVVPQKTQIWVLYGGVAFFLIETLLFIRWT